MRLLPPEANGTFFPHPMPPVTSTTTRQVFGTLPTTTLQKTPVSTLGGPQIGPGGTALPQPAWPTTAAPSVPISQTPTQTTPVTAPPQVNAPLILAPTQNGGGGQTQVVAGGAPTSQGYAPAFVTPGISGPGSTLFGGGGFTIPGTNITEPFPWWVLLLIVLGVIFVARET